MLETPLMFDLAMPFTVDSVMSGSNSALRKGDAILSLAGTDTRFLQDARGVLDDHAGQTILATVSRDGQVMELPLQVDTLGKLGISVGMPPVERRQYNFFSCIPAGLKLAGSTVSGYLQDLKMVFTPSTGAYKSVGSFIAIGQVFPKTWDWYRFLNIVALLSIMLGVMNLIPIPGLDGGHILFTLFEMISGRKPSEKFLMIMQAIGMVLLMLLMILAFGNDISRLIH